MKCGIDALQYIVFQKHLLIYSVIIFCLSIGIVLPVNYSGHNGEYKAFNLELVTITGLPWSGKIQGKTDFFQGLGKVRELCIKSGNFKILPESQ